MNTESEAVTSRSKEARPEPSPASSEVPRSSHVEKPLSREELVPLLSGMKAAQIREGAPTYDERIRHLDKLERTLLARKDDIARAIDEDFGGRSHQETLVAEVGVVVNEIRHTRAHLHEWMETQPREMTWMFLPARAEVVMQPLGVIGVIAPWNYPLQLAIGPLVAAIAAGNRVMIKPSELTPKTGDLLHALMTETFAPDHVTVVRGGLDVAEAFASLPFDHLLFTGSTRVGKVVMRAASENLVPVTLELGGKSPAIVAEGTSLSLAATRIMHGKLLNAGQTCIAPDYVLVPRGREQAFVEECRAAAAKMFPRFGDNRDYTAIVNERHRARLQSYLDDAKTRGAEIVPLSGPEEIAEGSRKMLPVAVLGAKDGSMVLEEEIFGPILPIIPYGTLDEAIAYVNERPRPLALYVFDHDQKRIDKVLAKTVAGGVCVNETLLHCAISDLPFGGVGASGMGHYHGREGFETFTKKKPVLYQARVNPIGLLRPPYGPKLDLLLKFVIGK